MINDAYQNRKYVLAAIMLVVILIYVFRLFSLQILESKYKEGAESNALLKQTLYAPRGLIFDRNGKLMVYNKSAYDIMVIMREVQQLDTLGFCEILGIDKEYFDTRMSEIKDRRKNLGYSSYTPQLFMSQLDTREIAAFQQILYRYPGFYIQNRTLREYAYPNAAHVLGSIGEVPRQQVEADDYYRPGDYAGREGIEYVYEKELRGEKGVEVLLRDARGRIKGRYEEGKQDVAPKAGTDLNLTIDIDLQQFGERVMSGKIGSIVAIEPATGEILAMVSNPTFDPSILIGRERSNNYAKLAHDQSKPLLNRATHAQYSPGSTFKIIQALICQDMGGITPHSTFTCYGPESQPIRCTHHHKTPTNLYVGIEQSCNPYFWYAFRATLEKDGYGERNEIFKEKYRIWEDKVRSFGLGSKIPDTDIYDQLGGFIPGADYYTRYYGETGWKAMTIRSLSIGQGEILVTPLQLANFAAAVANEGYYVTPHLRKTDSLARRLHYTEVDNRYFEDVKIGMKRMMTNTYGGMRNLIPGVEVGGKTGTVQNPHGEDHALYIGFAPLDDPKIAIAVVVENAGFGASYALPIASLMIEQYLFGKVERKELLERMEKLVLNPDVKRY